MIDWRDPDGRLLTAIQPRALARWGAAVVVVVAVHGAAVWLAMHWRSAAEAAGEPPPAVMIDLSPMSVAPEAPPQEVAPGPQMTEAQPVTAPEQQEAPKPQPDAMPEPPPEPEVKVPNLPKANDAAATLTPSPPEPPKEVERKPTKPPPKKKVERKKPRERVDHAAPRTSAPPATQAQRAERAAARAAGAAASAAAAASWRSELMAHLNRYKRFPSGAGSGGVVTIAFTINRSGQVTSSRLLRSSGDSVLDAEAVALPRRASPVPAPPPGTGGRSIGLSVPIRFSR